AGLKARSQFTIRGTETPPVHAYDRTSGGCVLLGSRYRGAKWSGQLDGKVIYGDNIRGSLYAMTLDPAGAPPVVEEMLSGLGAGICSGISGLGTDDSGEIYVLKLNGQGQSGGTIRKLATAGDTAPAPALLSATGLFSDTASL